MKLNGKVVFEPSAGEVTLFVGLAAGAKEVLAVGSMSRSMNLSGELVAVSLDVTSSMSPRMMSPM